MNYVIFPLTGDYSKVAEAIEKELNDQKSGTSREIVDKLSVNDLRTLVKKLSKENTDKEKEIDLMKEELNELYGRYNAMCAAFGEMNHFVLEAARVPSRHLIEK